MTQSITSRWEDLDKDAEGWPSMAWFGKEPFAAACAQLQRVATPAGEVCECPACLELGGTEIQKSDRGYLVPFLSSDPADPPMIPILDDHFGAWVLGGPQQ